MKTIKLLSILVIVTFTALQVNAQNEGIGAPAHPDGLNGSGNNVRLVLNGGFETGFTGTTTAMTFNSGSEYGSTSSSTSGYLGFNWQKSGSSSTIGFSSTNRLTTARADTGTAQNIGGQFRTAVDAVSGTNPYEMAGVYGDIRSATWNGFTTNGGFAGAIVGIDKINGKATYAGYFDGKGYFRDRVGIGISTPTSNLHVKNKGATNPFGAPGNWAAKIENNLDVPGENGLFVANRWGTANESTVFEAGSWWSGSTEIYTPILTVTGGKQVGIGTNTPSEKLTLNGNMLFGDGDKTNTGESGLGIEWHTSSYGSGFGHKIYAIDPSGRTDLRFAARHNSGAWTDAMTIFSTGAVGIGTTDYSSIGTHKLGVDGSIVCEELKVKLSGNWPDYVFGTKHNLKTIKELEVYIKENNHLPGVPSEAEVKEKGIEVSEMLKIQMEKIEELTLYVIQLSKENEALRKKISE